MNITQVEYNVSTKVVYDKTTMRLVYLHERLDMPLLLNKC